MRNSVRLLRFEQVSAKEMITDLRVVVVIICKYRSTVDSPGSTPVNWFHSSELVPLQ